MIVSFAKNYSDQIDHRVYICTNLFNLINCILLLLGPQGLEPIYIYYVCVCARFKMDVLFQVHLHIHCRFFGNTNVLQWSIYATLVNKGFNPKHNEALLLPVLIYLVQRWCKFHILPFIKPSLWYKCNTLKYI